MGYSHRRERFSKIKSSGKMTVPLFKQKKKTWIITWFVISAFSLNIAEVLEDQSVTELCELFTG